jgi:hypothetical protein
MQVTIKIPEELAKQAKARGVPLTTYVEELLAERATDRPPEIGLHTEDAIRGWLDSLAQFSDKIPELPATISRDWIYQEHD